MSKKLYSSIQIVCALKRVFPELVVEKIRNYTKLAIDLNGYTLQELKNHVCEKGVNMSYIEKYIGKKYRNKLYFLKREQVINVIHKFNIDIPLCKNRLDNHYKVCNKFNKYYVKEGDNLVLCDKETNEEMILSTLEPIRFVHDDRILCLHPTLIGERNYSLKILNWEENRVKLLIFVRTKEDGLAIYVTLSHIEFFAIIIKYIQKKPISDELINIRELTKNSIRNRIESISDLKKFMITLGINECKELCRTDIVYLLVVLFRNSLREFLYISKGMVDRFDELENILEPELTKLFELSEYFEHLFDTQYEINLMEVNFDYYEMVIRDLKKTVCHEYNTRSAQSRR